MAATYMLRKHLRLQELGARPEAQARRKLEIDAARNAAGEVRDQFPVITPENFERANDYRVARTEYWKRLLGVSQ